MNVKRKKIENAYSLSPLQEGFLFQSLYASESGAYFVQSIFEIEGKIDISSLKKAWQKVSDYHPVLRTGFVWQDGKKPFQYVLESVQVPFEVNDWRPLREGEQNQKLEIFIKEDRQKDFNLNKAPLFRIALLQYAENRFYLIWSQHHILADGWSTPIILEDVFKTYEALKRGKEAQFTSRLPYRNYIAWLQKQDLIKAESFWKESLASLEGPTRLSFRDIIEENQEEDYETYSIALSIEETDEIKAFVQQHGLTLNTVIQGAVGLVLKTYIQRQEIVLGVTLSGRSVDLPGVEEMVGLFINTLPLIITSDSTEDTIAFLKKLQEQTQKLNEYAYTPLAQIQSWSGINQSLFDVIFVFENYPVDEKIHDIASDFVIRSARGIEKTEYPLTVVVGPGKQLHLTLSYQTKHFNKELIKKFSDHTTQIIREILHHSKENPKGFSLLTQEEKRQLLVEWNDTQAEYPEDRTIHQLFEEQAEKTPHNIAIAYEDQELTYQQLNEKANQLAHYLRSLGVGPDTLVALAVERSLEMIVGLLGILKAGGAYVPLDPTYPDDRLQFMLEDTNTSILITQAPFKGKFKGYLGKSLSLKLEKETRDLLIEGALGNRSVSYSDSDSGSDLDHGSDSFSQIWESLSSQSSRNPLPLTTSRNLAYVIYTSGSTGKPKGVMAEHKNIVRLIKKTQQWYNFTQHDVWTLFHSYAFDFSIWEIWGALSYGGKLIIVSYLTSRSPEAFYALLIKEKVTILNQTPSAFYQLIQQEQSLRKVNVPPPLCPRLVIFGGEALEPHKLRPWWDNHEEELTQLVNMYGITETTVHVTYFPLNKEHAIEKDKRIIGRRIPDLKTYILDKYLNPVPVGVEGEIYIGGMGLARGYLNRPDLTAEKFIPNPFVNDTLEVASIKPSNLRLYQTGDLARYLPDGNIEFLGRIDNQVKIRGFRIELGEIESALSTHGDVSQAVVIAREDDPDSSDKLGNKKLVAYAVLHKEKITSLSVKSILTSSSGDSFSVLSGETLSSLTEGFRNYLARSLPDYMVPSFFVYIDKIPLTSNGKVDRKSLPAPNFINSDSYLAPRNELEIQVCRIWAEVLKLPEDKVGIRDDFFRLGGNSILAIQLIGRLNSYYNSHVQVADIFVYKNIEALLLKIIHTKKSYQSIIKLNNSNKKPNMFMIHPGRGGCEAYSSLAHVLVNVFSCYGVDSYNVYNEDKISNLHELAKYYLEQIDKVMIETRQDEYILLGWSLGAHITLEIACILEQRGNTKIKACLLDYAVGDQYLLSLINENDAEKAKIRYKNNATKQGYDKSYIEKILSIIDIEDNIINQKISLTLSNTKILLFKAMLENKGFKTNNSEKICKHKSTLEYNNIDKIHENKSNIKVVKLNDAHHGNILDQEELIASEIISNWQPQ